MMDNPIIVTDSRPLIDVPAAHEELSKLSRNAKLHLQDRLGNGLYGIKMATSFGSLEDIKQIVAEMESELKKIKLFD